MKKPTIGVYSFSSCSGCQISILDLEDVIVELLSNFNIKYFHLIQGENRMGEVDIAFVEGAITTKEHLEELKRIRDQSKILVAIGACACTGGIPAMKSKMDPDELKKLVYKDASHIRSIRAQGVDRHVKVDHYVRGCPITKEEFLSTCISLLVGKKPYQRDYPVCTECRIKENACLLEQGIPCLGPLAYMGCGAPCPSEGYPCFACRGEYSDARLKAYLKLLDEKGIKSKEIKEVFDKYVEDRYDIR